MWTIWTISSVMWLVKQSEIIPQSSPFWLRWCGCHSQIGGLVLPTVYPLSQAPDRGSRSEIQPTQTPPPCNVLGDAKTDAFLSRRFNPCAEATCGANEKVEPLCGSGWASGCHEGCWVGQVRCANTEQVMKPFFFFVPDESILRVLELPEPRDWV